MSQSHYEYGYTCTKNETHRAKEREANQETYKEQTLIQKQSFLLVTLGNNCQCFKLHEERKMN